MLAIIQFLFPIHDTADTHRHSGNNLYLFYLFLGLRTTLKLGVHTTGLHPTALHSTPLHTHNQQWALRKCTYLRREEDAVVDGVVGLTEGACGGGRQQGEVAREREEDETHPHEEHRLAGQARHPQRQHQHREQPTVAHHRHLHAQPTNKMFYLTTHSTHFIYGYMASDIW